MEALNLANELSPAGMYVIVGLVVVMEILSLCLLWLNMYQYRTIAGKRRALMNALQHDGSSITSTEILLWVYIILTLILTVVTGILFLWQPHVL